MHTTRTEGEKHDKFWENYDVFLEKFQTDFPNPTPRYIINNQFMEIANYGSCQNRLELGALLFDMDNDGYKDIYV
jgi:hypothetical protein